VWTKIQWCQALADASQLLVLFAGSAEQMPNVAHKFAVGSFEYERIVDKGSDASALAAICNLVAVGDPCLGLVWNFSAPRLPELALAKMGYVTHQRIP
jgi:hypothetical protein